MDIEEPIDIVDFSLASTYEVLISELEKILQKISEQLKDAGDNQEFYGKYAIDYMDDSFELVYYRHQRAQGDDLFNASQNELAHRNWYNILRMSGETQAMFMYPIKRHKASANNIIEKVKNVGSNMIQQGKDVVFEDVFELRTILSAVTLAMLSSQARYPCFFPVFSNWRNIWKGIYADERRSIHFESCHMPTIPLPLVKPKECLEFFVSKSLYRDKALVAVKSIYWKGTGSLSSGLHKDFGSKVNVLRKVIVQATSDFMQHSDDLMKDLKYSNFKIQFDVESPIIDSLLVSSALNRFINHKDLGTTIVDQNDVNICIRDCFGVGVKNASSGTAGLIVPFDSLLLKFCSSLLTVFRGEGLQQHHIPNAFSFLSFCWPEFIDQIRLHWEQKRLIPFVLDSVINNYEELSKAQVNLSYSILHQKLEMINYCILLIRLGPLFDGQQLDTNSSEQEDDDDHDDFFDVQEERLENGRLQLLGHKSFSSKEDLYIPVTQHQGFNTEDMLQETQSVLENLGSTDEARAIRTKMQSAGLLSDMESFKAANPGCCLEDFISWHSPRDIKLENGLPCLSDRMSGKDSIWHSLWNDAKPIPAKDQKPLFSPFQEAEKAIHWLENITIDDLIRELAPIASLSAWEVSQKNLKVLEGMVSWHVDEARQDIHKFIQRITEVETLRSISQEFENMFVSGTAMFEWFCKKDFQSGEMLHVAEDPVVANILPFCTEHNLKLVEFRVKNSNDEFFIHAEDGNFTVLSRS
ncbi:hypothetical protein MP638_006586 [Amoeboaphelidium occidentale]|nr:hypothetical protein MP638_006586 [Amoeboaphelidium occidentale]